MARYYLADKIGLEKGSVPRDIDIIRFADINSTGAMDHELAETHMSDDYIHGHGVKVSADNQDYFTSRDFTINEVYATDDKVVATPAAIESMLDRVLELAKYERENPNDKLLAKAVRFQAKSEYSADGEISLSSDIQQSLNDIGVSPFHMALHLDRAWEGSYEIAKSYVEHLKNYDQLPDGINSPEDAVKHLSKSIYDFEYKHAVEENDGLDPMERLEVKYQDAIDAVYEKHDQDLVKNRQQVRKMRDEPFEEEGQTSHKWRDSVRGEKLSRSSSWSQDL